MIRKGAQRWCLILAVLSSTVLLIHKQSTGSHKHRPGADGADARPQINNARNRHRSHDKQNDREFGVHTTPQTSPAMEEEPTPVRTRPKVFYLKMHKCASSTIAAILSFWGLRNNMTFALPSKKHQFWPNTYKHDLAVQSKQPPELFISHVRDSEAIDELIPKSQAIYVTSLRDPVSAMESLYNYAGIDICLHKSFNAYFEGGFHLRLFPKHCEMKYIHNLFMFDLGMQPAMTSNRYLVGKKIEEADKRFQLVLIQERLEESLILLRDMIGASTGDVAMLKTNFRREENKASISNKTRAIVEQWNWADKLLYEHFKNKTYALLDQNKKYISGEVESLRNVQKALYDYCIEGTVSNKKARSYMRSYGQGTVSYQLTKKGAKSQLCLLKSAPELTIIELIRSNTVIVLTPEEQAIMSSTTKT